MRPVKEFVSNCPFCGFKPEKRAHPSGYNLFVCTNKYCGCAVPEHRWNRRCTQHVDEEEALDGEMPTKVYEQLILMDKNNLTLALRGLVELTKSNIKTRLLGLTHKGRDL